MKRHLSNAAYGVLDYAAFPLAMLAAAPPLLRSLGTVQYGVWVVASAAVSVGSIVASGFGDANIQYVSTVRSDNDRSRLVKAIRSMIGINIALGCALAAISWMLAPVVAHHVIRDNVPMQSACLWSLRIASLLMPIRALESVCISTQRAFERYSAAIRLSALTRVLTIAAAVALARLGLGVVSIMVLSAVLLSGSTLAQLAHLQRLVGAFSWLPAFDRATTSALFGFGTFSWIQAVSGVLFSQADRLILGVALGAGAVTSYALCVQMAQPIYGIAASGLHFLFPYLAGRHALASASALRTPILKAFAANVTIVALSTAAVLLFGQTALHAWVGAEIASSAAPVLVPIVLSFALLGLNVTAYYALLALGRVRLVALINLTGGACMLAGMAWLLPHVGIRGVAMARVAYGFITLLMYLPLIRQLLGSSATLPSGRLIAVCEEA